MKAKLAYLTTPAPGRYVLNFQVEDEHAIYEFEISQAHLANIIIDGTSLALRQIDNRVPNRVPSTTESGVNPHDRTRSQQQRSA